MPHPLVCRPGDTALMWAVYEGHESTVCLLVESRADLTAKNIKLVCARRLVLLAAAHAHGFRGETALGMAIDGNESQIAAFLRSAGAAE